MDTIELYVDKYYDEEKGVWASIIIEHDKIRKRHGWFYSQKTREADVLYLYSVISELDLSKGLKVVINNKELRDVLIDIINSTKWNIGSTERTLQLLLRYADVEIIEDISKYNEIVTKCEKLAKDKYSKVF